MGARAGQVFGTALAVMALAATALAPAADAETGARRPPSRARKPSLRRAQVVGAATGVLLGLALRDRDNVGPPLTRLGPADVAIAGSALLLNLSPHLFPRQDDQAAPGPPRPVNGF